MIFFWGVYLVSHVLWSLSTLHGGGITLVLTLCELLELSRSLPSGGSSAASAGSLLPMHRSVCSTRPTEGPCRSPELSPHVAAPLCHSGTISRCLGCPNSKFCLVNLVRRPGYLGSCSELKLGNSPQVPSWCSHEVPLVFSPLLLGKLHWWLSNSFKTLFHIDCPGF